VCFFIRTPLTRAEDSSRNEMENFTHEDDRLFSLLAIGETVSAAQIAPHGSVFFGILRSRKYPKDIRA